MDVPLTLSADAAAACVGPWLDQIADLRDEGSPGLTRLGLTPSDIRARRWFVETARRLGLAVRADRFANLFAHSPEAPEDACFVMSGSHLDSVINAGRYDGVLGVLLALWAVAAAPGPKPLWPAACVFTCEESSRFGTGCLGSRLWMGELDPQAAAQLTDSGGVSFERALAETCEEMARWPEVDLGAGMRPHQVSAFYEAHVEQGRELFMAGRPVGVVSAIAAPSRWRLTFHGEQGHSGGLTMDERRDALVAAAETIVAAEEIGARWKASGLRCTVGTVSVSPGVMNTVAGTATIGLDLRSTRIEDVEQVRQEIGVAAVQAARKRGVSVSEETLWRTKPHVVAGPVVARLSDLCKSLGCEPLVIVSRGAHDAMFVGHVLTSGMIFVRNPSGVSHHPNEACEPADIGLAALVLAGALAGAPTVESQE